MRGGVHRARQPGRDRARPVLLEGMPAPLPEGPPAGLPVAAARRESAVTVNYTTPFTCHSEVDRFLCPIMPAALPAAWPVIVQGVPNYRVSGPRKLAQFISELVYPGHSGEIPLIIGLNGEWRRKNGIRTVVRLARTRTLEHARENKPLICINVIPWAIADQREDRMERASWPFVFEK